MSGDGGEISFTPNGLHSTVGVDPIPPEPAVDGVDRVMNGARDGVPVINRETVPMDVFFHDAVSAGWVIRSPVTARITTSSDGEVVVDCDQDGSGVVTCVDGRGESVIELHTLWDVEFPDGFAGYVTRPLLESVGDCPVLPSVLCGAGESCAEFTVMLRGASDMTIGRGDAIAQLLPMTDSDPGVTGDVLGEDGELQREKERRRRSIHGGSYRDRRFQVFDRTRDSTERGNRMGDGDE